MNGYDLTRAWYNYKFENPSKVKANHSDLFFYVIDLWNRLGQKKEFGLPTSITMEALGIGSRNTYYKIISDLCDFGFVTIIETSKNQHQSRIIAISKNEQALDQPLDQAHIQATSQACVQPSSQTLEHIIEQLTINKEQLNKKQKTKLLEIVESFNSEENLDINENIKKIDFQEIAKIFNNVCIDLPKIKSITEKRKNALKARLKKHTLEDLGYVFSLVAKSEFLNGKNDRGWKADFDWILKHSNFIKILEGNYQNKSSKEKHKTINRQSEEVIRQNAEPVGVDFINKIRNAQKQTT